MAKRKKEQLESELDPATGLPKKKKKSDEEFTPGVPLTKENYAKTIGCTVHAEKNEVMDSIVEAYIPAYSSLNKDGERVYRQGFAAPQEKNGRIELCFRDGEQAFAFFSTQAKLNKPFIVVDKANNVMAYSLGDGTLYSPNHQPMKKYTAFISEKERKPFIEFKKEFDGMEQKKGLEQRGQ